MKQLEAAGAVWVEGVVESRDADSSIPRSAMDAGGDRMRVNHHREV